MKVVLDTNVFISGLFWKNDCSKILELWNKGKISLVIHLKMIDELKRVLNDFKIQYPQVLQQRLYTKLIQDTQLVLDIDTSISYVSKDKDDDIFIQVALQYGADYVISQDIHLLDTFIENLSIVTPRQFLIEFTKQ